MKTMVNNIKIAVENEIKLIHSKYEEGIKNIKPSFEYIVMNISNDDFIVTNSLDKAKEKAIEYGDKLNEIFDIYKIEFYPDKTYRAVVAYSYFPTEKDVHEEIEIHNCMHISWRTRGELLEVCY